MGNVRRVMCKVPLTSMKKPISKYHFVLVSSSKSLEFGDEGGGYQHYKKFGLQRRLKVVADALKVAANVICDDIVAANSGCVCSVAVGFSATIFSRR